MPPARIELAPTPALRSPPMPNGKPGDNPVTDVVVWGKEVFTPEINELIREIDRYTTDYGKYDPFWELDDLLFDAEADAARQPELHRQLLALKARIEAGQDVGSIDTRWGRWWESRGREHLTLLLWAVCSSARSSTTFVVGVSSAAKAASSASARASSSEGNRCP
jgi:hypothetical protein